MTDDVRRALDPPSAFFCEHVDEIVRAGAHGPILDLACGSGRHAVAIADRGLHVVAVDRNPEALERLREVVPAGSGRIEVQQADLESEHRPPLPSGGFGAVLVFRYLHRPLMDWIEGRVAPGGLLVYETFLRDQKELGWGPTRDDFLLAPKELPTLFPRLEAEVYEEGPARDPRAPRTARLLARRST